MKKGYSTIVEGFVLLFLGLFVFVVFSHMRPIFNGKVDIVGRIIFSVVLLFCSIWIRKTKQYEKYWRVLFAFFIALVAISIDLYLPSSKWLLSALHVPLQTPAGLALDKLDSSLIIIGCILLLTKASGEKLTVLYFGTGNTKKSLLIGIVAFVIAASGAIFVAELFGAQNLEADRILSWIPWILIFIFGNAFNEELLFRGLLLNKMEPFIGRFLSNLVIAIPFVLHHTGVTYSGNALLFLAYLLPLSLLWGYITQKTGNLLGAVLFHAGTDIPVVLVIFSML